MELCLLLRRLVNGEYAILHHLYTRGANLAVEAGTPDMSRRSVPVGTNIHLLFEEASLSSC